MGLVEIIGAGALIQRAGGTSYHWAGAVVDVDDDTALRLMEHGVAIESNGAPREAAAFEPDTAIEPEDHQVPVDGETSGLEGMTVVELRAFAKREGIKVPASVSTRDALLAHLRGAQGGYAG